MTLEFGLSDVLKASPMIALFLFSLIPITLKVLRGNKEPNNTASLIQGLIGLLLAAILLVLVSSLVPPPADQTVFARALVLDGLTLSVGLLCILGAGAALVLMHDHPATSGDQFAELVFLALNATLGMLILTSALDLLVLFIGLETMSLSLYLMIGMSHEQKLAKESAFKYFVLGSFASGIFLYGLSFLFGTVGSTSLSEIIMKTPELIGASRLFLMGLVLVVIGFCFKVSIVPFHAWTPDVYQGAPTPHTSLMATAVKAVSFAAFLRVLATKGLIGSPNLFEIMQWLAVLTMIVGNVAALIQTNMKRMLAYSSVAHSGYLLVGLIASGSADDMSFGASTVVFYLMGYSLMTMGAFAVIGLLEKTENTQVSVDNFAGFAKKHPVMGFCLTLFLLSLAGIPPTVGFFGKFYLFSAAVSQGLLWLALWGVLNSVLSVYYYLRPIVSMYMMEGADSDDGAIQSLSKMWGSRLVIGTLAFLTVFLGIFSGTLYDFVERLLGVS